MFFRLWIFSFLFFLFLGIASAFGEPFPALCEHPQVRVRSAPTVSLSEVTGYLDEGDEVFILEKKNVEEFSGPWYKVQSLKKTDSGWVYGKYLKIFPVQPSLTQQLAWQVLLDYGNTPEQARVLFGAPEKIKEAVLDGGKKEKKLIFMNHSATYQDDILTSVVIHQGQKAGFGKYFPGGSKADLLELSKCYIVDHDSLIFLNEQHDEFRFDLESEKVVRMVYHRASPDERFLPACLDE